MKNILVTLGLNISIFVPQSFASIDFVDTLPVSTYIDKSKLYPYSLSINSDDFDLFVDFNEDINRFNDIYTQLHIDSNIPSKDSGLFSYQLMLSRNDSECTRYGEVEVIIEDVMQIFLNGSEIEEGESTLPKLLIQEDENGFMVDSTELMLRSKEITNVGLKCRGEVAIIAELSI